MNLEIGAEVLRGVPLGAYAQQVVEGGAHVGGGLVLAVEEGLEACLHPGYGVPDDEVAGVVEARDLGVDHGEEGGLHGPRGVGQADVEGVALEVAALWVWGGGGLSVGVSFSRMCRFSGLPESPCRGTLPPVCPPGTR